MRPVLIAFLFSSLVFADHFIRFLDENTDPTQITLTDPNTKIWAEMPGGDLDLQTYRAPHSIIQEYSKLFDVEKGDIKDFEKAPDCTRAEIHALKQWTTNNIYAQVNGALRKLHKGLVEEKPLDKKIESAILVIASGVNCAPQYSGQVVRVEETPNVILKQYVEGAYIFSRGFTSTTKGLVPAEGIPNATQQIFIPNAQGADIDSLGIAEFPAEKEVLIRPGTVFLVTKREIKPQEYYKNVFEFKQHTAP